MTTSSKQSAVPGQTDRSGLRWLAGVALSGIVACGIAAQAIANLFDVEEPLPAEQVFVPEIAGVDGQRINVRFDIHEGYYLYRDKLSFTVSDVVSSTAQGNDGFKTLVDGSTPPPTIMLKPPVFGASLILDDEFFGEQAIFRNSTLIGLPYSAGSDISSLTLNIKYQGCADIGLCYPPTNISLTIEVPASGDNVKPNTQFMSRNASALASSSAVLSSDTSGAGGFTLGDLLGDADSSDELLPPELAYLPQVVSATSQSIAVRWFIEDGYYLYRDKLGFSLTHDSDTDISNTLVSEGIEQFDDFFGNVQVLRQSADATLELATTSGAEGIAGSEGVLTIRYQGCADIGVCFPPSETSLPVLFSAQDPSGGVASVLPVGNGGKGVALLPMDTDRTTSTSAAAIARTDINAAALAQSEQDRLFELLGASSIWLTVATFFGLGLLLAFTPCVLPMIPILSSLIVGQGQSMSTARAFQLSLVYVLVMASTYAAVGIVVGLSGYNVQAFLQSPYVLSGIAVLFVLLSLSMFGFYELQMPTGLQARLTQWSNKQGGGQVGGVAAMGFISTLIVGPCVTAPLAGALIYIAKTGDAVIGGAALFALGLGMGAPLLLIGTSAGKLVPRAGAWMNTTKSIFGILMLGMAIYMISRFLPTTVTMTLYGVLALMSGVYLGATDSLSVDSSGWRRFGKGAGLVVSIYGLALLMGAFAGGNSYLAPLNAFKGTIQSASGTMAQSDHALPFVRVKSVAELDAVVAQASTRSQPVMLDFYADWCVSCKEMEAFTFSDSRVQNLLSTAVVVQADVTANDALDDALLKKFELFGPPAIIFYNAKGEELRAARVVGFMNAENFASHISTFIAPADKGS